VGALTGCHTSHVALLCSGNRWMEMGHDKVFMRVVSYGEGTVINILPCKESVCSSER